MKKKIYVSITLGVNKTYIDLNYHLRYWLTTYSNEYDANISNILIIS